MQEFEARRREHLERARALAATLPAGACLSHATAAVVHGLSLYGLPNAVDVTRTRGYGVRTSDVHVRVAGLRPHDVTEVDGLPVTSVARTAVDVCRRLPFVEGLVVMDSALQICSRRVIGDVLRHQWTWPGIRRAGVAVHHANPLAESALESVVRGRIVLLHLPMPRLQVNVRGWQGWVARSDFVWEEFRLVGEADGRLKYVDDELWAEKQRQDAIEDAGYDVIRWTWRSAHDPDDIFRERLQRKMARGAHLRTFYRAG